MRTISFAARLFPSGWLVSGTLVAMAISIHAQIYQTRPEYSNPVQPSQSTVAYATLVSGSTYAPTTRPTELNTSRFQIDNFQVGAPFSSSPPDFNFGDLIPPPPLTDTARAPTVITANGAFYMESRKQLIAAQVGECMIHWPRLDGTTNIITYTISPLPSLPASRLFWTDDLITGAPLNTNTLSLPSHTGYAVSLQKIHAKIHYNSSLPDFDTVNTQDSATGRAARSDNAIAHLDLPAVWIDRNNILRARQQSGYFILEYFDTPSFANTVGYEIVHARPAEVFQTSVVLGDRLLPSEGKDVAKTLQPSTTQAGDRVVRWSVQGSHFFDWVFAVQVNSDVHHPTGDPTKTQILWQRTGTQQVLWPYETHWYGIAWPGDEIAKKIVFDPVNLSSTPAVAIHTNYTARVVWSEVEGGIIHSDGTASVLRPLGEGRALIQLQNDIDGWFIPVRVTASSNGAYHSNQDTYWPVGVPLQPMVNHPRLQFNGSDNYLTFQANFQSDLSLEMWIKPHATNNNQTLAAILDYPQQASVQVALSLTNGFVQLAAVTEGNFTVNTTVGTTPLTPNTWSHVSFTKNSAGEIKLFVNGAPDGSMTVSRFNSNIPILATHGQIVIGNRFAINGAVVAPLRGFEGEIREIRIWDTALSGEKLRQRMSMELTGNEAFLAHWITPDQLESYTPTEGTRRTTFLTPNRVTGKLIEGYGAFRTTGQLPFPLKQRLKFNGTDNWVNFSFPWNRTDPRTIEFWMTPHDTAGNHSLLTVATTTATNLQISIVNSQITLTGINTITGPFLDVNATYHIAISASEAASNGTVSLFVDGNPYGYVYLAAPSAIGTQILLGTGSTTPGAKLFEGKIEDFRAYTRFRSATEIAVDRVSLPNFEDPDLVRYFDLDLLSPATSSIESVIQVPDEARGYLGTYHGTPTFGGNIPGRVFTEVAGGIVRSGTAYHYGVYTNESRILPVNSVPNNPSIEVWWNDTFKADYLEQPLSFPSIVSRYRIIDPLDPPILVLAGQNSSGYKIASTWEEPRIYYQNNPNVGGYNPNEEHALIVGSSVYGLRWDLNTDTTSRGYALLEYKDRNRGSLSYLQPISIVPTNSTYPNFDGRLLVGQLLQAPKPMTDMPPSVLSGPLAGADPNNRLYQDRKNYWWARSAVFSGNPDSIISRWHYPLQDSFYWPTTLGKKSLGDPVPFGNTTDGIGINYTVEWPPIVPHLAIGQSLSDAAPSAVGGGFLPAVTGQKSVEILYDSSSIQGQSSSVIIDPTNPSQANLANLNNLGTATEVQLGKTYFTLLPPHLRERVYWDPQTKKLNLLGQIVRPVTGFPYLLPAWLGPAGNTNTDYSVLAGLSSLSAWRTAVGDLRRPANIIPNAETPFDSIALTPTGVAGGYVTLGMNTRTNFNNTGDPISLYPIFVDTNLLFTGVIIVQFSNNKFDEYTSLRHSGDFGGNPSLYQFDWRYSGSDEGQAPTSDPASWVSYRPITTGLNRIIFGGPGLLTLKDTYFSVRWRCIAANAPNGSWSDWTEPVLVEDWLSRALDGINPFEQRVASLANNHLDLTTSILSQAGKPFVGDVPLNMNNVNDHGLIEIYETLLARARNLSIDSGYSDDDVNTSLLHAAHKLNELYTILGDEALSDANDPTIAWGNRDLNDVYFGSRASSLYAFQGIVPNLLEEELGLLRGMDDTTSTPVTTYPVYNRLYWNFTKGITGGEPAYALNYGIQSLTDNNTGSISEADAAKWYPQGHGDAYGHFLTAITTYYRLLMNTNFTWYPRAEVKVIGGVNVTFNYLDERKMAGAALSRARAGLEIIERTFRRDFEFDSTQDPALYEDRNTDRAWSATDWCARTSQGALYDWIVINSLLPSATPDNPSQNVSRGTVPELKQLADVVNSIQEVGDAMDRGDSPMKTAANVVPFDLDPTLVDSGVSHFEQIATRAAIAMQSAYAILERANLSAANLRRQSISLETFRHQVNQREAEFKAQLIDLYGTPYADDIGPSGTFSSGYNGPDLYHFSYIDREIFSPDDAVAFTNVSFKVGFTVPNKDTLFPTQTNTISYSLNTNGIPVLPTNWMGRRMVYGKIQAALGDHIRAGITLRGAVANQTELSQELEARLQRLRDHNTFSEKYGAIGDALSISKGVAEAGMATADYVKSRFDKQKEKFKDYFFIAAELAPKSVIIGLANGGDLSFPIRATEAAATITSLEALSWGSTIASGFSKALLATTMGLNAAIKSNDSNFSKSEYQSQTTLETTILLSRANAAIDSIYAAANSFRQSWQAYESLVSHGNQLQTDLLAFRANNASRIQEARYADAVFRTFRNEDLEDYLTAFDLAARYTYAAARVYDYETGLLDPSIVARQNGDFMGDVMRAGQLGDMLDGQPVLGSDNANTLASVLGRMRANWGTLEGRFGINNPTRETHAISLRQELFRIGNSTNAAEQDANNTAWRNALYAAKIVDLRQLPEFKNFCQVYSPMADDEPAIVIQFSTEITSGNNVFGLPLAGGDNVFDPAHFTTKIRGATVSLVNYSKNAGSTLSKSPRVYLVPVGIDRQRTPISGGTLIRDWQIIDQVWPIPYASAAGNVKLPLEKIGGDNLHVIRKFAPLRAYDDEALLDFQKIPYDTRLIGRSVWNTRWVLIIPAATLSSSTTTALDTFVESVDDIKLHLETYAYSGN